jgi:exonuclease VII large subunit
VDQIRLDQFLERFHVAKRIQLSQLVERCVSPAALVKNKAWAVSHASLELKQVTDKVIVSNQNQLASLTTRLETSNFVNILRRGFAILQDQHQNLIESTASLQSPTHISIRLRDGVIRGVFTPENI